MERDGRADLKSMTLPELTEYLKDLGEKPFRAKQLYQWMHVKLAASLDEMTNLSKEMRGILKEKAFYASLNPVDVRISQIDGTRKYLFELEDGNVIESVLMRYKHGNSVCISSQVGCRMGCRFCASTLDGLERNLRPSEMLEQIYRIQRDTGERVSNVVVMGSGEPMDNYDNLIRFIHLLTDENGLHISQRNVTVSTCGIVPRIRQFAEENLQVTLALSLHAPNDEVRKTLMPVANSFALKDVLDAMDSDNTFRSLYGEVQRLLGRSLNTEELKILLGFVRYLGLTADVISLLVCYCKERARQRGSLRNPSLRTIEKEAYNWAERGIDTVEEAAAFIQAQNVRNSRLSRLMSLIQIRGRSLTAAEERYAQSWLDMGMDDELISMAYERTCLNTGGLNWAYMNKILQRWQQQGFHSAEDVRTGDRKTSVPKGASGQLGEAELEAIQKVLQEG